MQRQAGQPFRSPRYPGTLFGLDNMLAFDSAAVESHRNPSLALGDSSFHRGRRLAYNNPTNWPSFANRPLRTTLRLTTGVEATNHGPQPDGAVLDSDNSVRSAMLSSTRRSSAKARDTGKLLADDARSSVPAPSESGVLSDERCGHSRRDVSSRSTQVTEVQLSGCAFNVRCCVPKRWI